MNWWDQFVKWVSDFTSHPAVVSIITVLTALIPLFVLFSKTSFGRRAIDKLTSLYELGERKATETLEIVKKVETLANEKIAALEATYSEKTEELKKEYECKIACALSIVNFYEESVFCILGQIPNAKVQSLLADFESKYEEKKWEITQVVDFTYQTYLENLDLVKQEVRKEYDDKISFLEDEIKKLELYIKEIKGDESNGEEREEESNSDPIAEEIQEN